MNQDTLDALAAHCHWCAIMVEHVHSSSLAVAQHALTALASHNLSINDFERLQARVVRALDLYEPVIVEESQP